MTLPDENLFRVKHLFSLVTHLHGVQRFSRVRLHNQESVLEHTGMVCIFGYVLTHRLNALTDGRHSTNLATVLARAVVHDWDETITGDITRPTKYFSFELRNQLALLERIGILRIEELLNVPCAADHAEAKDATREGFVLALCDVMASIHSAWHEVLVLHNYRAIAPAKGMRKALRGVVAKMHDKFNDPQKALLESIFGELNVTLEQVIELGILNPITEFYDDAN